MEFVKLLTFMIYIQAISSLFYDEPGGCANSVFLESTTTVDSFTCLSKCISYIDEMGTKCYFSTFISYPPGIYDHNFGKCLLFQTCTKLDTSSCINCLTSTYADAVQCDKPGVCDGQLLHTEFAVDKESCLSLCKKFEGCNWYSFDFAKDNICQMFETCPEIDSNWLFVSGQKECENDYDSAKILVATGSPSSNGKHSEVISLRTNNDPWTYPDPPYDMYGGTGGFINGSALVCGGFVNNGKYNKCSFLGDTTLSIVMKYERVYTSSLVLRDKLLVIGGVDQNYPDSRKTTEIIDRTGAMPGPDLPCAFSHHCVTQINEISAIILGGISGIQPETTRTLWLELHSDTFSPITEGPSMIGNGRINHACTTIRADDGSNYVIAAGGLDGKDFNHLLETSEILHIDNDLSGSFSPGPNLPQRCQFGSMVTLPMGKEALLIGCSDSPDGSTATDKIFKLSWQGGYLNWITIEKKLKFPRTNAVVMLLPGTHYCWNIRRNNLVKEFENWGHVFNIELAIKVKKLPLDTWTNIFHFTADGDDGKFGAHVPALFIHNDGYFHVCSAVNNTISYCKDINFVLETQYQMAIIQYKQQRKFWFEVIVNDERQLLTENTHPRSYSSVKLYASDPWLASFSSDLGSICNFNIRNIDCWEIRKNHLVNSYINWGYTFSVEFTIKVTKLPYLTWTNVFHFTASGDNSNDGDRIPALFIKNQNQIGYFQICNGIKNVAIYHEIYIGKVYQFIIKQYKQMEKVFYQIIIDDESIHNEENKNPQSFSKVKLYASDPWTSGFSEEFGNACHFNIVGAHEKKFN